MSRRLDHCSNLALLTLACVLLVGAAGCGGDSGGRGEVVARARPQAPASPTSSKGADGRSAEGAPASVGVVTQAGSGVLVDVAGAVRRPGVYRLGPGARVLDAITAAGGARPHAQLASLNRAAPVVDGQQVVVPDAQAGASAAVGGAAGAGGSGSAGGSATGARVSLGSATAADLDGLPGIGPVTAAKIVADRTANGAFASVDDLDRVPGIGPAMVEQLRDLVTT